MTNTNASGVSPALERAVRNGRVQPWPALAKRMGLPEPPGPHLKVIDPAAIARIAALIGGAG